MLSLCLEIFLLVNKLFFKNPLKYKTLSLSRVSSIFSVILTQVLKKRRRGAPVFAGRMAVRYLYRDSEIPQLSLKNNQMCKVEEDQKGGFVDKLKGS